MLFKDFALADSQGWVDGAPLTPQQQQQLQQLMSNASSQPPQQQQVPLFGSDLDFVNGSYSGNIEIWYINTPMLCTDPDVPPDPHFAPGCTNFQSGEACQVQFYNALNPDRLMVPGAAAYEECAAAGVLCGGGGGGNGRKYGVQVVLPAVLASVGGGCWESMPKHSCSSTNLLQ